MAVRRNTENRLSLIRTCHTCGRTFSVTADSPFMRSMPADGKKGKTCYFCSEGCMAASYKHIGWFDGKAEERRRAREASRDCTEKNRRYYQAHAEEIKAHHRELYWSDPEEYRERNRYNREKRRIMNNG